MVLIEGPGHILIPSLMIIFIIIILILILVLREDRYGEARHCVDFNLLSFGEARHCEPSSGLLLPPVFDC